MAKFNRIKQIYDFYTQGLNYKEVQKLFNYELPEIYEFYTKKMKPVKESKPTLTGIIYFIRDLFIQFLRQLTPIRRIIYTVAILMFILSYFSNDWGRAILSFILINLLIAFELADKIVAKNELAVAREIQMGLMPKSPPNNSLYDISCYSEAAKEVGGDYYDFICLNASPERTYIIIGDISGKGMAAALHMVQVQSILHHLVKNYETPKEILIALNSNLKNILKRGSFFTVTLACLNSNRTLHLSRAGHMPLIWYRQKENRCSNIIPKGIGVGLSDDILFNKSLEEIEITPEPGDILIFYTDGIVEAMNKYKQEYGEQRFTNMIMMNSEKPAGDIQAAILNNIALFTESVPPHDDLTMIVMKAN